MYQEAFPEYRIWASVSFPKASTLFDPLKVTTLYLASMPVFSAIVLMSVVAAVLQADSRRLLFSPMLFDLSKISTMSMRALLTSVPTAPETVRFKS